MSEPIELSAGSGVPEPDPAQKFLGVRGSEATEYTLLGVAPGTATRDNVLTALRSQLARVAQHPEAGSKEAAQARVMLHAAAARLLGSTLASEPTPAAVTREMPPMSEFERAAVNILAMHGGMNAMSLKLIRQTAAGMGVAGDELTNVLTRLPQLVGAAAEAERAPRARVGTAAPVRETAARREVDADEVATEGIRRVETEDPTKRLILMAAGGIVAGLVLLAGVGYGLRIIFTKKPATPVAVTTPEGAKTPANATPDAPLVDA
ncbi:MAG: hypothetical protein ACOVP8_13925, partial [Phycisphaerales bacterium]